MLQSTESTQPIAPLTAERDISVEEAYKIQQVYNAKMTDRYGKVTGYKVAYASKASQEKWNIDAPTFGAFFEAQQVENGGTVRAEDFITFHNESELTVVIAKDIRSPLESVETLMPYLQSVHVGLDVPDNRFDGSRGAIGVADIIAISCATHTYVIGEGVDPETVDFENIELTLERNGEVIYSGSSSNVMGDPREAVLILANHLLEQGTYLKQGDLVLTGSVAAAYSPKTPATKRGTYVGKATGLPPVELIVK